MKVLVLGASGMLGSAVARVLSESGTLDVFATVRGEGAKRFFDPAIGEKFIVGVDVENVDALAEAMSQVRPDVVVNCVGVVKQLAQANDPLRVLPINSMLPHRLAKLCAVGGARLIHVSTDCVFSGNKGLYLETDESDATDLYGKSKFIGEVHSSNAVTLRTSIIGQELQNGHSLIDWFLSQDNVCRGYTKALFSGVPTVVLAKIIRDVIIPRADLSGLYHVAAEPISKYDLLRLVAEVYHKAIQIIPDDSIVIDRSLDGSRFRTATGYTAPVWSEMIKTMHAYSRKNINV
jgi:dTDP-4-dehydrorhamnose reductase